MPPQNKVDSLNSASSDDSPDSSVEPDHVTSMPSTSLPTSTLPRTSASLPVSSASLPVSSASVLCKPCRAAIQQHKLMASFDTAPHNGLEASRQLRSSPDDHSDKNLNFNNSVYILCKLLPYATVVSAIKLGPNDMPKGKTSQPEYREEMYILYNLIMKHV